MKMKSFVYTLLVVVALAFCARGQEFPNYTDCLIEHISDIQVCANSFDLCNPFTDSESYDFTNLPIKEYCGCFTELLRCYSDVCPDMQSIIAEWQQTLSQFCSDFSIMSGCYFQLFNDPHLVKLTIKDGKYSIDHWICNQVVFPDIYTSDKMKISGFAAGGDAWIEGATSLQNITVVVGGSTFTHTVSSSFSGTAPEGVSLSPHRISVRETGESVSVIVNSGWINIEIFGKCEGSSTVHVGCPEVNKMMRAPTATEHPECASLPEEYRAACNYDIDATGDASWANASSYMSVKMDSAQIFLDQFGDQTGASGSNTFNDEPDAASVASLTFIVALVPFVLAQF